jgi:hypothetical protein
MQQQSSLTTTDIEPVFMPVKLELECQRRGVPELVQIDPVQGVVFEGHLASSAQNVALR